MAAATLAFLATSLTAFSESRWREARLRRRFEQHLAPGVVERIIADPGSLKLTGERREVTALFTDIEGFTQTTREAGPEQLVAVLDGYFEGVTRIVGEHGGMVDKLVGDAVHALFNAPLDLGEHPRRALACAVAILDWTESYRAVGLAAKIGLGRTRQGLETGSAIVGAVRADLFTGWGGWSDEAYITAAALKQPLQIRRRLPVWPPQGARLPAGKAMSIRRTVVRRWDTERSQTGAPTGQPIRSEDMSYIDGFVIAVPTANKQKFIEHARHFDAMFIELGALRVIEGWGDDVPDGKVTDFRRAVQATADETVAFSWVEWPDKATRDAGMKKMMEDPRMDPSTPGNPPMPFDGKRMIFGGFEQVVEVKA
eukprot:gene40729-53888_t